MFAFCSAVKRKKKKLLYRHITDNIYANTYVSGEDRTIISADSVIGQAVKSTRLINSLKLQHSSNSTSNVSFFTVFVARPYILV